ncbi:MAG: hypothetical protein IKU37_03405 [Candidatus Gastranaerophilales bacterium]|nr:hypothetical protein [Candidatus Gastranaerophilales bacterium]
MDISLLKLNSISMCGKTNKNNLTKVSFKSRNDIIQFSDRAIKRNQIVAELQEAGYDIKTANELVSKYINTDKYKELTQGFADDESIAHWVGIDRHLNPAEAILYLEFDMDDYYMQHSDVLPEFYEKSSVDASSHQIGEAEFLPIELAKYNLKGFDLVLSGLILKGKLSKDVAMEVNEYYKLLQSDMYLQNNNVQQAEYSALQIANSLEIIKEWVSDERGDNGELKSGLIRPFSKQEAAILATNSYMPQDISALNNYIKYNKHRGYSLFDMASYDLWQKDFDTLARREESTKPSNIMVLNTKMHYETIPELISALNHETNGAFADFYDDVALLDTNKFIKVLSAKQLRFDASMSFRHDRSLRQTNIQALNSMSDELITKITTNKHGKRCRIATLDMLLMAKELKQRIEDLENYRLKQPELFNRMDREAILNYLTNSDFYSDVQKGVDDFLKILSGKDPDDSKIATKVIPIEGFK